MALLSDSEARQIQHSWKIDSPRLPDWGLQAVKDLVRYEADRQERIEREKLLVALVRRIDITEDRDLHAAAVKWLREHSYGEEKHD